MRGYSVTIEETSRDISAKERVMLKDTTNALSLDELTTEGAFRIKPAFYAVLNVHNEKAEDKDYHKYVVIGEAGEKVVTGSESFYSAFCDIMDDMADSDEDFEIEIYRKPSKNYKGKEFITCSLV